ncbi:hypothetical protein OFC03_26590, partial [Escherichia coli]|nr:hypothetical protein [Escherichia coli]
TLVPSIELLLLQLLESLKEIKSESTIPKLIIPPEYKEFQLVFKASITPLPQHNRLEYYINLIEGELTP